MKEKRSGKAPTQKNRRTFSAMDDDLIMEEREELMVSPAGGQVAVRRGHFLKPIVTSINGAAAAPSLSYPAAAEYKDLPLNVSYQGCKIPSEKWKAWVDRMHELHHSTWKKAGIVDAIMNSKSAIHVYSDLIFDFVEKWCSATNSFVFQWGEATVTLEDIMVLGGYPVLGEGILAANRDEEIELTMKKLQKSRYSITKTNTNKACHSKWMARFMGSESEIEHEAFLAYWLSRFVFPLTHDTITRNVVSISVHLARGSKIALAPAVLSAIYKGLSLLKAAISAARKSGTENAGTVKVTVPALALVQVWIWERFQSLRPKSDPIGPKPGLARWHNLKLKSRYRSLTLDGFQWRPYTTAIGVIYRDDEQWAKEKDLDEDLLGFVRCLRASELVSLDCSIEQYLPHRVAMQFGMDQDLPGHVPRINVNTEIAWKDYSRPIRDAKIYIPSRLSQPYVTARYSKWWKKLNLGWGGKEDSKLRVKKEMIDDDDDDVLAPPPGFSPKRKRVEDCETRPRKSVEASLEYDDSVVPLKNYGVRSSSDSNTRTEKQAAQLCSIEKKRVLVEPKVKCEEDEEIVMSGSGKVQDRKSRTLGEELEEKITCIEKLIAALKAGVL